MSLETDTAAVIAQEQALVLPDFDEARALSVGLRLKALAERDGLSLAIDRRHWNHQLFAFAMPGTSADNADWMRRKINVVQRLGRSSYRFHLQLAASGKTPDDRFMPAFDFAAAGGSFPITIRGVGVVGAVSVSGAPMRLDHELVVEALCTEFGFDHRALALPPSDRDLNS